MERNQSPQLLAGGTIQPCRFVKVSTVADNTGLQVSSTTADFPIGISQVGTKDPPGVTGAGTQAADAGDPIQIFGIGDICLLEAGSGGFTHGSLIKSDTSGRGVNSTPSTNDVVCAIALETPGPIVGGAQGIGGSFGRVQILSPWKSP